MILISSTSPDDNRLHTRGPELVGTEKERRRRKGTLINSSLLLINNSLLLLACAGCPLGTTSSPNSAGSGGSGRSGLSDVFSSSGHAGARYDPANVPLSQVGCPGNTRRFSWSFPVSFCLSPST